MNTQSTVASSLPCTAPPCPSRRHRARPCHNTRRKTVANPQPTVSSKVPHLAAPSLGLTSRALTLEEALLLMLYRLLPAPYRAVQRRALPCMTQPCRFLTLEG